jgi:HJR/Mrr/RecB family endonuclease
MASMVIIAAAPTAAAANGLYQVGKIAVEEINSVLTKRSERNQRDKRRTEEKKQREDEAAALKSLSFEERLAKYKRERGFSSVSTQQNQKLTFNFQRHRQQQQKTL